MNRRPDPPFGERSGRRFCVCGGELEHLVDAVKELGFPIAVALFVLVRLNGKMDRLTEALNRSSEAHDKTFSKFAATLERIAGMISVAMTRQEEFGEHVKAIERKIEDERRKESSL